MSALINPRKPRLNPIRAVVKDGEIVRVKFCPVCGQDKVITDGKDSGFSRRHSTCKVCRRRERKEEREWLARVDPEALERRRKRHREAQHRWWEKNKDKAREASRAWTKTNREYVAEIQSINRVLREEREGKGLRTVKPRRRRGPVSPRVPAEPFRLWLKEYALAVHLGEDGEVLGRDLGVEPRRVRSVFASESENVSLDVVDRALINARTFVEVGGRVVCNVGDLYPEDMNVESM